MKKKDHYTELKKTFTDEEIAESFILPSDLSDDEQKLANEEFSKFLKERKMMKKLEDVTLEEFESLKQSGMLWEFYPDAPENWDETFFI